MIYFHIAFSYWNPWYLCQNGCSDLNRLIYWFTPRLTAEHSHFINCLCIVCNVFGDRNMVMNPDLLIKRYQKLMQEDQLLKGRSNISWKTFTGMAVSFARGLGSYGPTIWRKAIFEHGEIWRLDSRQVLPHKKRLLRDVPLRSCPDRYYIYWTKRIRDICVVTERERWKSLNRFFVGQYCHLSVSSPCCVF